MRFLRLFAALFKINVQMSLAYRADALVSILLNLMWLGWELFGLGIIFSNTQSLAGWRLGELIALLGVYRLVNALMVALVWPNTWRFNSSIRDGTLDYTLILPANSMFLVTFRYMDILRVWDLVLGGILIFAGVRMSGETPAAFHLLSFLLLAATGTMILYSLWIVLISITFWLVKFDNNVNILQALIETGRYPATVYPTWLRLIITFVIPVAVATTVPLQALRGELTPVRVLLYLVVSLASFLVASQIWRLGLRRYSGASA